MAQDRFSVYPSISDDPASMAIAYPHGTFRGGIPRDYMVQPKDMFASPSGMPLIPESEWRDRFEEQEKEKSSLEHLYLGESLQSPKFVNLDQNGNGYCWAYSTGHAIMFDRLRSNQPMVRLNPHATAAIIKSGRDEGGWSGLSAKFARETGYALEGTGPGQWPLHSRNLKFDTPELRAEMGKYKVTEEWVDLALAPYDQNLTFAQLATCLLLNIPCQVDYNWWSHAICAIRLVWANNAWAVMIINSWKGWGRFGLGLLEGSRKVPDGSLATRSTTA